MEKKTLKEVLEFLQKNEKELRLVEIYVDRGTDPVMVLKVTSSVWDKQVNWLDWPTTLAVVKKVLIDISKQMPVLVKPKVRS